MSRELESLLAAYLRHRPDLLRYFTARLRSESAAEDLVQEIYLRLRSRAEPVRVDNPGAYLFRLGMNLMVDRRRSETRAAARDGAWRETLSDFRGGEAVAESPAADDALVARQRLQTLVRALETLRPDTQRIFRLHKFDGLSYGEIARRLRISKSAVEKHMMTALRCAAEALR